MRQDSSRPYITWSAEVSAADAEEFKALLPITGARTWVIETGLEKFLNLMESSEALQKEMHDDIQKQVEEEKVYPTAKMNVRIPGVLYDRFNRLFPQYGAATWFWRRLLKNLNTRLRQSIPIEELIDLSVSTLARHYKSDEAA